LKLFFNPNTLIQVLDKQTEDQRALRSKQFNLLREKSQQRDEVDVLYYELVHNLVLELTRSASRIAISRCGWSRCRAGWTSTNGARGRSKASSVSAGHRARARATAAASSAGRAPGTAANPPPHRLHQPLQVQPPQPGTRPRNSRRVEYRSPPAPRRRGRRGGRSRTPGDGWPQKARRTEGRRQEDSGHDRTATRLLRPHRDDAADADFDDDPAARRRQGRFR
jgi:hypothetical protein